MQNATVTQQNVRAMGEIEKEVLAQRSLSIRIGDFIATQAGRVWFIIAHALWFTAWIAVNRFGAPAIRYDPYPYSLLTTIVSLESIFLSLFILMSQTRSSILADQRNHLDLQINLLSEHENTKMLRMLQAICAHHDLRLGTDPEVEELAARTDPKELLEDLKRTLPHSE